MREEVEARVNRKSESLVSRQKTTRHLLIADPPVNRGIMLLQHCAALRNEHSRLLFRGRASFTLLSARAQEHCALWGKDTNEGSKRRDARSSPEEPTPRSGGVRSEVEIHDCCE